MNFITLDIPGAFLRKKLKRERIHVRFEGRKAELLEKIDRKLYRPHICREKGIIVIYAELQRAFHGILKTALWFLKEVLSEITELCFVVNPYDHCVANRMMNGHRQIGSWHVDYFLVTHMDAKVHEEFAAWFDMKYGRRTSVTMHWGRLQEYLGIDIYFSTSRKMQITMEKCIKEMLEEAPEDCRGTAPTPPPNNSSTQATNRSDSTKLGQLISTMYW